MNNKINYDELKFGNLVIDEDGEVLPITAITMSRVWHDKKLNIFSDINTIRPLCLSLPLLRSISEIAEIIPELRKQTYKMFVFKDYLGGSTISQVGKDFYFDLYNSPVSIKLLSFHQFQNLYFALTGQEITFKRGFKPKAK